ncbi:sugar phosphate isomerase/epimerase [Homoserinibacter sp. GY 40078]|uniref:sugar phosphate isomerase/epimerase family protein n=1 Tax=Homoserinibacter sp. GY 40078 TaxID=2603275 RepID=UPI0011C7EDA8|nr:sugar phosphate isomerase/epimerase [Homoserinibacter sp. GY 40078]TXK18746.1 sugar phosphate isomerase/epimerase [Homoserinibacter sp. GY 40078]
MPRPSLSVQLYTVRDAIAADADGTLARLAQLGFRNVEPYDLPAFAPVLEPALAAHGLAAPTSHASLVGEADLDAALAAASALGVEILIEPAVMPERWGDRDAIAAVASELAEAARRAADHGMRVGYHNHHWETEIRIDGAHAIEVFADLLPDDVALELDTYWAAVGGADPVALLERLGERVAAIHVKDGPVTSDTSQQQPAGQGELPIREILAAAPNARPVLEFDEYAGDLFDGLAAGVEFVTELGVEA